MSNLSTLEEVTRLSRRAKTEGASEGEETQEEPSRVIRLRFRGPLPKKVSVNRITYNVSRFHFRLLRCFNCHHFGHGALTCRNKVRCRNCSGYHHMETEGRVCSNDPSCYFCGGNHRVTSRSCPVLAEAVDLHERYKKDEFSLSELQTQVRSLNPTRRNQQIEIE